MTSGTALSSAAGPATPGPAPSRPATPPAWRGTAAGLTLLGLFLLGFLGYLYGLSGLQEARAQATAYATFRYQLSQQGTQVAPLGAATPGAAVAILNIPAIGIRKMIVVEGTSPENLELGPGHLRDTPLPGQYGVAEIFGRRATFGAPFAHLAQLRPGDTVTVITGQGTARYTIAAAGDSTHLVEDPAPNRLLLVTGCPGPVPTTYCYFDADLTSPPQPDPGGRPAITPQENPLSGDDNALVLTLLWGLALLAVSVAATAAATRWPPLLVYLAAAPPLLAVLWNLYQSLAALLPNIY
jgi:sortase A